MSPRTLILASKSPRRGQILLEHGFPHESIDPGIDDGELSYSGVPATDWVVSLAHLKARAGVEALGGREDVVVLGGDTVVVTNGRVVGQPRDGGHARDIIRALRRGSHEVISGAAIVTAGGRVLVSDRATVHVGVVPDGEVDRYIASGGWRGKAGAYNLAERIAAGWDIRCDGDPNAVMGLPMRVLAEPLRAALVAPARGAAS